MYFQTIYLIHSSTHQYIDLFSKLLRDAEEKPNKMIKLIRKENLISAAKSVVSKAQKNQKYCQVWGSNPRSLTGTRA